MDIEKVRELIKNGKAFAANAACRQLAESFEEFIELYHQKEQNSPAVDGAFLKRLDEAHQKFWVCFEKVASSFGFTVSEFKNYVENPNNFSPQQWAELDSMKRDILGTSTSEKKEKKGSSLKKLRNKQDRVRV